MAMVQVEVSNENERPLGMVVAIIGLPGGLEVRYEQLQEMVTRGVIPFFEVKGREVVLYWRTLKSRERVSLSLEASAVIPGNFTGPASRVYEYYASEFKQWSTPLKCTIKERGK
jgi:hypothetical protein